MEDTLMKDRLNAFTMMVPPIMMFLIKIYLIFWLLLVNRTSQFYS